MEKYLNIVSVLSACDRAPQAVAEERQFRALWPSGPQTLYSLTLSSNHATHDDAYQAYDYVISRLPQCEFFYVHDLSVRGKRHIHGIAKFKYEFNYRNLMDARSISSFIPYPVRYDIHIKYDLLEYNHFDNFRWYMIEKETPILNNNNVSPIHSPPVTCIPQVIVKKRYKSVTILL